MQDELNIAKGMQLAVSEYEKQQFLSSGDNWYKVPIPEFDRFYNQLFDRFMAGETLTALSKDAHRDMSTLIVHFRRIYLRLIDSNRAGTTRWDGDQYSVPPAFSGDMLIQGYCKDRFYRRKFMNSMVSMSDTRIGE